MNFLGCVWGGVFSLNWRKCVHASAQDDLSPLRLSTSKTSSPPRSVSAAVY